MQRSQWYSHICRKGIVPILLLIACCLAPLGYAAEPIDVASTNDIAYEELKVFAEVLMHIKRQYIKEKSYKEIIQGGLHGLLQSLDPHSDFLDTESYRAMQEDTAGKFSGIGINIGLRDGFITIIAPIEDTPAFRAGLLAGDAIVEIDARKTQGMALPDVVRLLRGAKGEKVSLGVRREGEDTILKFEIIRDDIEVPSVKGGRIIRKGIGYVRITQFAVPTADSLQKALDKLKADGMQALVLDLRNNHGGLLKSAIDVSEKLLKKDDLIVTTRGRPGVHDEVQGKAAGDVHIVDIPMAVLVNGGSASASEIVAGAFQDHRRAILVGEKTYGKASVQSLMSLKADDKLAIRLTIAQYFTPKGRQIHEKGIDPDIVVEASPKDWQSLRMRRAHIENPELFTEAEKKKYEHVVDAQLDRAVDVLEGVKILQGK